jgi:hypothetical protein
LFDSIGVGTGTSGGTEKLTNGTFTGSATGWTLGTDWSYGTNVATRGGTGTNDTALAQTSANMATPLIVGDWYILSYSVSNISGPAASVCSVYAKCGGYSGLAHRLTENGTYTDIFQATTTDSLEIRVIDFPAQSRYANFDVDNVTLKRVADGNLFAGNQTSTNILRASNLYVKEGTNATMGLATLVAGVAVVNTTAVTANSRIFLTRQTTAGTLGTSVDVTARTAGTSFTITSNGSVLDTSTVAWIIYEPFN